MLGAGIGLTIYFLVNKDALSPAPAQLSQSALPEPSVPTPGEFKVAVDVTGQECPEPEKCRYTYSVRPNYTGNHPLPSVDFTVFYDVIGGFEPQQGSLTVSGGQAKVFKDVVIEGPPNAQFAANVTQVSAVSGPKPVS